MIWLIVGLVVIYAAIAVFAYWHDQKIYKQMSSTRVCWNPKTKKYAYSYQDKNEEKWIEVP